MSWNVSPVYSPAGPAASFCIVVSVEQEKDLPVCLLTYCSNSLFTKQEPIVLNFFDISLILSKIGFKCSVKCLWWLCEFKIWMIAFRFCEVNRNSSAEYERVKVLSIYLAFCDCLLYCNLSLEVLSLGLFYYNFLYIFINLLCSNKGLITLTSFSIVSFLDST